MKKKATLIADLMELYDRIDELEKEKNDMELGKALYNDDTHTIMDKAGEMTPLTVLCLEYGKKKLFDSLFENNDYRMKNKMTSNTEGILLEFDQWLETLDWDCVCMYSSNSYVKLLLSDYSLKTITEFFKPQLKEKYDRFRCDIIKARNEKEEK